MINRNAAARPGGAASLHPSLEQRTDRPPGGCCATACESWYAGRDARANRVGGIVGLEQK